ncbi:MAG TPA: ABC transporter ATP-binding protein [Lentimicrobium sp.]|nr:ABC transporter ATP-binding protein [Lentimicrobium sp.]
MIEASGIEKSFANLKVLKGVSLVINKGEIVSLTGASGAGKSTLLHILGTLEKPDKGKILINGTDIKSLDDRRMSVFRNQKIGFVFQFHHLLPEFTAFENICIPAFIAGKNIKASRKRAMDLMDLLGISERMDHKPSELSGGEQQRVAIARALINEPSVLMADEPSGNLDSVNARQLHSLFFDLRKIFNQTILIVTHNEELAEMADRRIFMKDGQIFDSQVTEIK